MNAKQWRANGFKTIFRNGAIYIVRIEYKPSAVAVAAFVTPVDNGRWMNIPEFEVTFTSVHKLTDTSARDISKTIAACYCDQIYPSICDFCAGTRPSPDAYERISKCQ